MTQITLGWVVALFVGVGLLALLLWVFERPAPMGVVERQSDRRFMERVRRRLAELRVRARALREANEAVRR